MKLTHKKVNKTSRVIIFGEPKSGKTELVARLAEHYKLIYFDLENGFETMLKLPLAWQERIDIVSIPDTKTFPIAIETLLKVVTGNPVDICDTHGKVSCPLCKKAGNTFTRVCLNEIKDDTIVVIDSLTQLSNSAMNHITKDQEDTYKPEWPDYRSQGQLLDKFLSQIQQAPYNICCITHVVETELEDGAKRLVPTCGTTAFSRNTAKYFDHVVYCQVKNRKHCFASSTTYSSSVLTGSRTDVIMEAADKPSLISIYGVPAPISEPPEESKSITLDAPELPEPAESHAITPGQTAVSNLKQMIANRKAGK